MGDTLRHSSYSRSRIPRQKRTIPIYGEKEDANKWFRCWNCGYICNSERDQLDTSEYGRAGITYSDTASTGTVLADDPYTGYWVLGGVFVFNSTGGAYPVVTGGCPFCGTKNWR
jgi:hypothetical protein